MFRAHYAEFDKTMRHENANSIRYVAKKKLREEYSTPIFPPHCFSSTSKNVLGYGASGSTTYLEKKIRNCNYKSVSFITLLRPETRVI